MATIVLFLYIWGLVSGVGSVNEALFVNPTTMLIAAVSFAISVACYLWTPNKYTFQSAAVVYILLIVTTSALILQSGGINSPFVALWLVPGVLSGIFSWGGIALALVLANSFIVYSFFGGATTPVDIMIGFLTATMPILMSFLLWHDRTPLDASQEKKVNKLSERLERESSKADAIIQAIGDGVITVRQTGEITLMNTSAQTITGWSEKKGKDTHYRSVLRLETEKGDDVSEKDDPIARVLNSRQPARENNLVIRTKSDSKVTVSFTITPLEGELGGAIAVFRDVTAERKKEREQTEFISTASHEMRTPVASIEGYLGLALNPATAQIDEKAREFIQKAHEATQHLGHLFQDLLNITKTEDGRLDKNPEVIDMTDFARDILESLTPQAEEKGLTAFFRPDGTKSTTGANVMAPVLYAHADKNHLREVIANLIENAIKYTPSGKVEVDVDSSRKFVRVIIKDSGLGIPAEDIPHLFQKFYRVDNTDTRVIGGTGLGLYLCRRLIESMNGRIWVESKLKQGSQFYIEIPRLDFDEATRLLKEAELEAEQNETPAPVPSRFPAAKAKEPAQTPAPVATQPPVTPTPATPTPKPSPVATQSPAETPKATPSPQTPQPELPPVQTSAPLPQTPVPMPTPPPSLTSAPKPTPTPSPVATQPPATSAPAPATPAPTATQSPDPETTWPPAPKISAAQQLQDMYARRAAKIPSPRTSTSVESDRRTVQQRNSQQKP